MYKDFNGLYNVAGNAVNVASRVMSTAEPQQILLTADAYNNMIDMTEDTELEKRFRLCGDVKIKHGLTVEMVQYIGSENFINAELPVNIELERRRRELESRFPVLAGTDDFERDRKTQLEMLDMMQALPMGPPGLGVAMEALRKGDPSLMRKLAEAMRIIHDMNQTEPPDIGLSGKSV